MALLDLAQLQRQQQGPVTLAQVAERQDLSLSYLEQLFAKLRRAGLVKSVRGPGGGYELAKATTETWLGDIITAVNEATDMTRCGAANALGNPKAEDGCMSGDKCNAHYLWLSLSRHIGLFMQSVNLEMVLSGEVDREFVIPNLLHKNSGMQVSIA